MSERLNFEIFCAADDQERALDILRTTECLKGTQISFSPAERSTLDPETADIHTVEGFGIFGQAMLPCIEQLTEIFAAAGIAGYSQESRIIVTDPNNPQIGRAHV